MTYNKTVWRPKDVITCNNLNKIENGIEALSTGKIDRPDTVVNNSFLKIDSTGTLVCSEGTSVLIDDSLTATNAPPPAKTVGDLKNIVDDNTIDVYNMTSWIPDLSAENFDFQQKCVHHDNFHRTPPDANKPWQIGTNGNTNYPMAYNIVVKSNTKNYDEDDDGMRIENNVLTRPAINQVAYYRLVDYTFNTDGIIVEIGVTPPPPPSEGTDTRWSGFVYNFIDKDNYSEFVYRVRSNGKIVIYRRDCVDNIAPTLDDSTKITTQEFSGASNVKVLFSHKKAYIYFGNAYIASTDAVLIKNNRIGLYPFGSTNQWQWNFFNIFTVAPKRTIDAGYMIDT